MINLDGRHVKIILKRNENLILLFEWFLGYGRQENWRRMVFLWLKHQIFKKSDREIK